MSKSLKRVLTKILEANTEQWHVQNKREKWPGGDSGAFGRTTRSGLDY